MSAYPSKPTPAPSPRSSWIFCGAFLAALICAVLVFADYSPWIWPALGLSTAVAVRTSAVLAHPMAWKLAIAGVFLVPFGFKTATFAAFHLALERDSGLVLTLVTKEELILELTPALKELSLGLQNLTLPSPEQLGKFDDKVSTIDLDGAPAVSRARLESVAATLEDIPVSRTPRSTASSDLNLWRPLLDRVAYFEHADLYLIDGRFVDEGFTHFEADVGFTALARLKSGDWQSIKGKQTVRWQRRAIDRGATDVPEWRITGWETHGMHIASSQRLMFVESLDHALPDPGDLHEARRSLHEEAAIEYYLGGARQLPSRYFAAISANQKPGLSVVDINDDGFDDLYVTVRMGKNQLLLNQGDGTFVEAAARFGLDLPGNSTCAVFADFDNDGDPDVVVCRSIERSLYLENHQGRFTPSSSAPLPYLAISAAAADYNGDGLLDVYISTYRPKVLAGAGKSGGDDAGTANWPDEFLTPKQAREYYERYARTDRGTGSFHNFLDQVGPPNVLYVNRGGGRFEVAPESPPLELWRNTLQATWADFDEDGDPDLYVANDWAEDHLLRNDGPRGFVDVTAQAGTDRFGFAMGVTWGDYDQDGRQDLYVSNMYSKAGTRITADIEGLSSAYAESASGNYLYRQVGDSRFELVSGREPPALTVAEAGWSWGGQFVDIDNDTFLDLYVLSGYFTAPKAVASEVDI